MSNDNVISLDNFSLEKIDADSIKVEEKMKIIMEKAAEFNPTKILIIAINEDGDGRLFHTQLDSRFSLVGALTTITHWLVSNGLTQANMD